MGQGNSDGGQASIGCCYPVAMGFPLGFRPENVRLYEETATTLCNGTRAGFTTGIIVKCCDARGNGDGETVAVEPVCCIDGDKIGKAEREGGSGLGIRDGDKMYTLTAKDCHAVCYAMQAFGKYTESETASAMKAGDYKDATDLVVFDKEVYNSGENANGGHYIAGNGPAPTLRGTGHPPGVAIRYIVRRLTPTECARLQGFPDQWGNPDHKADFTDEEYRFWHEVRNTHARINGKSVKEYTPEQMLKWYNGLHTDSAEYKMWGNGIALPPALYCMQGIAEALRKEKPDG